MSAKCSSQSYPVKNCESLAYMQVTMSTARRQNSHSIELSSGVVQPIGVHLVVELHEVMVKRNHRHAMWRRLSDDCVNR